MIETQGNLRTSSEPADVDRLEQVTTFRVPHWKYKSVHVVSGKLTFAVYGGGHCVNVLVRDVLSYMLSVVVF